MRALDLLGLLGKLGLLSDQLLLLELQLAILSRGSSTCLLVLDLVLDLLLACREFPILTQ